MMCKKPFVRNAQGLTVREQMYGGYNDILAATPFGCGQCLPCKINKSRVWKTRILMECQLHKFSTFVTLTYTKNTVPDEGVIPDDLRDFIKRLRYHASKLRKRNIRFFGVGEYGTRTFRPHYHSILFGVSPFEAELVERAWSFRGEPYGHRYNGEVNEATCDYITGYVIKNALQCDPANSGRNPEFMRCSTSGKDPKTKGGIGAGQARLYAYKLKKNIHFEKRIINSIQVAGKERPIGRYLTEVINKELGITEKQREEKLYDYMDDVLGEHGGKSDYRQSIVDEKKDKRRIQKKRHEIFNQRRRL